MYPLALLLFSFVVALPQPVPVPLPMPPSRRMGQRAADANRYPRAVPVKNDYASFLCPGGVPCPLSNLFSGVALAAPAELTDWFRVGFECIDPHTELRQCGGCAVLGRGQDYSALPNTRATACSGGTCVVLSCKDGLVVDGGACVRAALIQ
ncbi:hypothetical protein CspeluHIS016_0104470 [Cutaneotrichosporon spelunceum]|uniref:Protein CPL1-like domain-containing protein n=1 Tax=Cutaneotrichosporon spelunceum TaxID=1672016 RepID=A0AAD3TMY6_9TREE|nr:hypothetical protein CspeluHIS016_0104470 [Cutaneotrichosporon spelunceum]